MAIICLHTPYNQSSQPTLSKILLHDPTSPQVIHTSGKPPHLAPKGILQIGYISNPNGCGWVLLFYYNRLEVVEIGESNPKLKTFAVVGHK
jgi:hypothetical protein